MAMSRLSISSVALPPSLLENTPTPFPFVSKLKKMDKVDGPDTDKMELVKLQFFMEPDNPTSKYSRKFAIFKD
jgi:hypothetical protein